MLFLKSPIFRPGTISRTAESASRTISSPALSQATAFLALKHSGLQLGIIDPSLSCDFNANFYSWFKLDQWLPSVFEPTGYCDEIQWSFFGLSMPQVMIGVYLGYLGALLYTVFKELKKFKSTHF